MWNSWKPFDKTFRTTVAAADCTCMRPLQKMKSGSPCDDTERATIMAFSSAGPYSRSGTCSGGRSRSLGACPKKERPHFIARSDPPRGADQETRGRGPYDHRRTQCMGAGRTLSGVRISDVGREFLKPAHMGRWQHVQSRGSTVQPT